MQRHDQFDITLKLSNQIFFRLIKTAINSIHTYLMIRTNKYVTENERYITWQAVDMGIITAGAGDGFRSQMTTWLLKPT